MTIIRNYCAADCNFCEGKFVQLRINGREHLVFAPGEMHRYHNQILARFLKENAVFPRWVTRERLEFDASAVHVIGGGRFRVSTQAKRLELWDNSQAYGRFDERGLAEKLASSRHAWEGFSVKIAP